jgi:hypothetical protein
MHRPKAHYRANGILKATAPVRPSGKLWGDDAQVVEYALLAKHYADGRPPGARITVRQLGAATEQETPA